MKMKVKVAEPVKRKDGTWDVIVKEIEEDVPDKGRGSYLCNKCSFDEFPECKNGARFAGTTRIDILEAEQ